MSYQEIMLCLVLLIGVYVLQGSTPAGVFKKKNASVTHQAQQLFNYTLQLGVHPSNNNPLKACILLHGFCSNKKQLPYTLLNNKCTLITFNFPDASPKRFFWRSSLGQLNEVKIAAFVLHAAYKAGFKDLSLYGISRGGAVALNLLRFLLDETYEQERVALNINHQDADGMAHALKKGLIVLQVPLTDSNKAIKLHFDRIGRPLRFYPASEKLLERVNQKLQSWSYHQQEGMQAYESAQWLAERHHCFKTVWYQALKDKVVCNQTMRQTFECLHNINPYNTRWYEAPGGHNTAPSKDFYATLDF